MENNWALFRVKLEDVFSLWYFSRYLLSFIDELFKLNYTEKYFNEWIQN